MFFMPYLQRMTHTGFPFAVALLVLINIIVFFGFQSRDTHYEQLALDFYTQSVLPDIELPLYIKHLEQTGEPEKAQYIKLLVQKKQIEYAASLMQHDDSFIQTLRAHKRISPDQDEYLQWQQARTYFEKLFNRQITARFAFKTDAPTALTAFTHQFLHGSSGHLFGNLLMLILIAPAVEALIGARRFILTYLISGLGAVGMFYLLHPGSSTLVGASGAISGAMGAFAVLLGMRRIPFFYFIIVYFDVIRAPALLALPIWIAHEVWQLFSTDSNVAYEAHIGGLVTGAVLACLWRKRAQARLAAETAMPPSTPEENTAQTSTSSLQIARKMMTLQRFDDARRAYAKAAIDAADNNISVLNEAWNIVRLAPDSKEYHLLARHILDLSEMNHDDLNTLIAQVFEHYIKNAQPIPKLEPSVLLVLAKRFLIQRRLAELERSLKLLHIAAPGDTQRIALTQAAVDYMDKSGETLRSASLTLLLR